jgi:NADH dehydrogenase
VDCEGNVNLIRAARAAHVGRFVLLSMHDARPDHPMELARMKHAAEEALRASPLDWTIVRPYPFMELWVSLIGASIAEKGKATVFGDGHNPISFNSVQDVAGFVELALVEPNLVGAVLDIGGPDSVTFNQLVERIGGALGRKTAVTHVPLPAMRVAQALLRPLRPGVAGMMQAGIALATTTMTFDVAELHRRFPQVQLTTIAQVIAEQYAGVRSGSGVETRGRRFEALSSRELAKSDDNAGG